LALGNLGTVSDRLGNYAEAKAYLEQSLRIYREIGHRQGKGETLSYLGLLSHHMGNDEAAREYSQRALLIAQDLGDRLVQGNALTNLGHALVSLGHLAEAATAYRQALALRRELGQYNLATEALTGLARVSLAQGDLHQAQAQVEEILEHLENHTLAGIVEPFRVYLTCYRVLRANHDPRAPDILHTAHRLLQERAAKISDEELRRSFLENVTAHREIMREFEKQSEEKP
jgi:tetratricopeptide (TPR) repeat protein